MTRPFIVPVALSITRGPVLSAAFTAVAALATCGMPTLVAQSAPAGVASDSVVRAVIAEWVSAGRYQGVAVGFVTRDNRRRVITYGPDAGVMPFDGKTVFEIGSITKTFTAAVLADMVRTGEVALDDPVEKHLPAGTVVPTRNGERITLLDLATHTSGLPGMPTNIAPKDNENPYADYTNEQLYAFLASYTLPRDIGTKYEYSNVGVGLLGQALSHRSGKRYEALVTERVTGPLKLSDTRITLTPSMRQRMAPGHTGSGTPAKNWDLPTLAAAGALRSTVNDMLTYAHANATPESSPLGAVFASTHSARRPGPVPSVTIGLGWHRVTTPAGRTIVWHNGGTGGYKSFTGFDESSGDAIVLLANSANSVDEIALHLLDASVPLPKPPITRRAITLPETTLEQYVGSYEFAPTFAITITRSGTRLFAQATNQPRFELSAEKVDAFFLSVIEAQITFDRDAAGAVTGMVLHQGGQKSPGRRR